MNICFYAPFKPLGHPHPSGDLVTATGIYDFLVQRGHRVFQASSLRCRWIYWKPWLWPAVVSERRRAIRTLSAQGAEMWFTYHSYYKAPDLLGPSVAAKLNIPYVVFQGIYSTKRRRRWITKPGFYLNQNALRRADHVFANKSVDLLNLKRLLPADRVSYVAPGITPAEFSFDEKARRELRGLWNAGEDPVIFSAAMFRADVKTEGLTWVIQACGELMRRGLNFRLVIAGDGRKKGQLQYLADRHAPGRVAFIGKIPRADMHRCYSAADLFVFPGIRESLGMVYLEAQSCGLPVVAFRNAGVPEAVQDGKTAILVPMYAMEPFADAIGQLISDKNRRLRMGLAAKSYVREFHDLNKNYQELDNALGNILQHRKQKSN